MSIFRTKDNELRSGWSIGLVYLLMLIAVVIVFLIGFTVFLIIIGSNPNAVMEADILENTMDYLINRSEIFNIVVMSVGNLLYCAMAILVWKRIKNKKISNMGITSISGHKKEFIEGLCLGAVAITLIAVILIVFGDVKLDGALLKPHFSIHLLWGLIGFIFVGLGEETFARGFAMSVLKQTKNKWIVLFVAATIFSISHVGNPGITVFPLINLFLIGILLGLIFMKTKSIWMGMGFHITWNYFQGYVWGFDVTGSSVSGIYKMEQVSRNIINGGAFGPEGGLAVTVVTILAIGFILYKYRDRSIDEFMKI